MIIEPDDPRLTAYALGELDDAQRLEVEAQLRADPVARREVDAIRQAAQLLSQELQLEQTQELDRLAQVRRRRPIQLPTSDRAADRGQGGPARLFMLALAAGIVILIGAIPLAIVLSNHTQNVAKNATPAAPATEPSPDHHQALPAPESAPQPPVNMAQVPLPKPNTRDQQRMVQNPPPAPISNVPENAPPPAPSPSPAVAQDSTIRSAPEPGPIASPAPTTTEPMRGYATLGQHAPVQRNTNASQPPDIQNNASQMRDETDNPPKRDVQAPTSSEIYTQFTDNPFVQTSEQPDSSFSIGVGTASYATIRRFLDYGALPPKQAVRIEEMLAAFHFSDAPPAAGSGDALAAHVEVAECPWQPRHRLVRIALKARHAQAGSIVATGVKAQVQFDPQHAAAYRLIGYEDRLLSKDQFDNDPQEGSALAAGQGATALYEVVPAPRPPLGTSALLSLRVKYTPAGQDETRSIDLPVPDVQKSLMAASDDFRLSAAIAEFGMLLRGSAYAGNATYASALQLAQSARQPDRPAEREGLINLISKARALRTPKK